MLHVNPEALIRQGWEVREGDGWREVNILDVTNEDNGVAERLRQDREKEDKMRKDAGQATVVRGWELVQNDKRKRTYTGFPSVALPPWASDFVETEIGTPEHGDEILKREMERLGMFTGGQDTPSLTTSSQVASSGNTSHLQGATATRERKPGVENGRPEVLCPSVFSLQKDTHIVL